MTKTFCNEFGTFTEGEMVRYDVFPLKANILGRAYEDRIETTDPDFLKECERDLISTHCLWDNVYDVRHATDREELTNQTYRQS